MLESFKNAYCPHCNGRIGDKFPLPEECPFCGGIVRYGEGGTSKGWYNKLPVSILTQDITVILMLVGTVCIEIYFEYPHVYQKLIAFVLKLLGQN